MPNVKLVIYTPVTHADAVRQSLGDAGAGKIGNYSHCSFSTPGTGRFLPNNQASPAIGQPGVFEAVAEERIEVTCDQGSVQDIVAAVKKVHPYEEIAHDIYPLL